MHRFFFFNNANIFLEFWFLSYYDYIQVQAEAFEILLSVKSACFIARDRNPLFF